MLKTVKMSDEKMALQEGTLKFRLYTLLFSAAIFTLTAVGLAFLCYKTLVTPFWFTYVYIIAWSVVFAFAIDYLIRDRKLSRKKLLLLTFSVMIIAIIVSHSVWAVVTPKWSFSVTTDKSTYELGENVQITVTLKNLGFLGQSFTSSLSDPVVVWVEIVHEDPTLTTLAWYSPYHPVATEFTIAPHQSLERNFTWNQTWTINLWALNGQTRMPGKYIIQAFIPNAQEDWPLLAPSHSLFTAYTTISIIQGGD